MSDEPIMVNADKAGGNLRVKALLGVAGAILLVGFVAPRALGSGGDTVVEEPWASIPAGDAQPAADPAPSTSRSVAFGTRDPFGGAPGSTPGSSVAASPSVSLPVASVAGMLEPALVPSLPGTVEEGPASGIEAPEGPEAASTPTTRPLRRLILVEVLGGEGEAPDLIVRIDNSLHPLERGAEVGDLRVERVDQEHRCAEFTVPQRSFRLCERDEATF